MQITLLALIVIISVVITTAFRPQVTFVTRISRSKMVVRLSDEPEFVDAEPVDVETVETGGSRSSGKPKFDEAFMNTLRQKMSADPNYNVNTDPEMVQKLMEALPQEYREFSNTLQRAKVALEDATTGPDAVEDLDAQLALMGADAAIFKNPISSPRSDFFKSGQPEVNFSKEEKDKLEAELKSKYPEWNK